MRVRNLMVADVVTIPVSATVAEASRILREREVSGAPVVDEAGQPVGVISRTDLAHGWEQAEAQRRRVFYTTEAEEVAAEAPAQEPPGAFSQRPVRDVMMPIIFSVQQHDSVRKAAALMTAEGIHRVVVLDGSRLVGVLSASAIVAAVGRGELIEA